MNKLNYLIIDSTATPESKMVSGDDVVRLHTGSVHLGGKGWKRPGYSSVIYLNGKLIHLLPFDQDDGIDLWGAKQGINGLQGVCRHIVYVGGMDAEGAQPKDTRTRDQRNTMETYVKFILLQHPEVRILGFDQLLNAGKDRPGFDVAAWLYEIGVSEKNIYQKR
jgi:N-acetylmuramoyl-L-alanine amidase